MNSVSVFSTRELARAIGVSESSIKRWADEGALLASRTAGGHRRIALSEAVRFIREARLPLVRPEVLGLPDLATLANRPPGTDEASSYFELIRNGRSAEARGLLQALFLRGTGMAAIVDVVVAAAMHRIGELWRDAPDGIWLEHRATDLCAQALGVLRGLLPEPYGARVVGGGAPGDPYLLAPLAASIALAAEGFDVMNLGPDLPLASLERAVRELRPALAFVSVSAPRDVAAFGEEVAALARTVAPLGTSVVVGGRALESAALPSEPNFHAGRTIGELVAFARGLRVAEGGARG
jgi:excisionase family DNA binding protein